MKKTSFDPAKLSMSYERTTVYMAWLFGVLIGIGAGQGNIAMLAGGSALTMIVMFGMARKMP